MKGVPKAGGADFFIYFFNFIYYFLVTPDTTVTTAEIVQSNQIANLTSGENSRLCYSPEFVKHYNKDS